MISLMFGTFSKELVEYTQAGGSDILSVDVITLKLTSMDINEAHAVGEGAL